MAKIRCYDAFGVVFDEATERFSVSGLKENSKKRENIKIICEKIDDFADEFGGTEVYIKIDEEDTSIIIELTCEEIEILDSKHMFYIVSRCANNIEFRCGEKQDSIIVSFEFPGIWD